MAQCYSTDQYIQECKLDWETEFECDGRVASWAPNSHGPRFWGEEDQSANISTLVPSGHTHGYGGAAMSSDGEYLAIAVNRAIKVFDVASLQEREEIVSDRTVGEVFFWNLTTPGAEADSQYTLVACTSEEDDAPSLRAWRLDSSGGLVTSMQTSPFPINDLVERAVDAVGPPLQQGHNIQEPLMSQIRDGITAVLKSADATNRVKNVPSFPGTLPDFGSRILNHAGDQILAIVHDTTTQHGMRPPSELPQIAILDASNLEEKVRLQGHKDAIMWAAWSRDDKVIATACWDRTFRLWDATTGAVKHVIGPTYSQNWSGGFLPDGKHVFLSGTKDYAVYEIATAREVARLSSRDDIKLDAWMRYFVVHPVQNMIVLQAGRSLLLWRPLSDGVRESDLQEIFALQQGEGRIMNIFGGLTSLDWVDGGKKLIAHGYENTIYVWDMEQNHKWRFQRPPGKTVGNRSPLAFFVKRDDGDSVVSVAGDGYIRIWKL